MTYNNKPSSHGMKSPLYKATKSFLESCNIDYQYDKRKFLFSFNIEEDNSLVDMNILFDDEIECIRCFATPIIKIPSDKLDIVLEKINDSNTMYAHSSIFLNKETRSLSAYMAIFTDNGVCSENSIQFLISNCYTSLRRALLILKSFTTGADSESESTVLN